MKQLTSLAISGDVVVLTGRSFEAGAFAPCEFRRRLRLHLGRSLCRCRCWCGRFFCVPWKSGKRHKQEDNFKNSQLINEDSSSTTPVGWTMLGLSWLTPDAPCPIKRRSTDVTNAELGLIFLPDPESERQREGKGSKFKLD